MNLFAIENQRFYLVRKSLLELMEIYLKYKHNSIQQNFSKNDFKKISAWVFIFFYF